MLKDGGIVVTLSFGTNEKMLQEWHRISLSALLKTLPYIVPQGIESFYHQSWFGRM
jgi:hypothetical protein